MPRVTCRWSMRTTTEVLNWFEDAQLSVPSNLIMLYITISYCICHCFANAPPLVSDLTARSILAQPKAPLRPGLLGRLMLSKGRRSLLLPRKTSRPPRTSSLLMTALATWRKWKTWRTLTTRSSLITVCWCRAGYRCFYMWWQQRSFVTVSVRAPDARLGPDITPGRGLEMQLDSHLTSCFILFHECCSRHSCRS
jgi:hypothetical protein